jgi:hypothetical protein
VLSCHYRYEKCTMVFYLSTYWAMATSFYLVVWEGVASVMVPNFFDVYMVRGFDVMLTGTFIFSVIATMSSILLLWRINSSQKTSVGILRIIWNEVRLKSRCFSVMWLL